MLTFVKFTLLISIFPIFKSCAITLNRVGSNFFTVTFFSAKICKSNEQITSSESYLLQLQEHIVKKKQTPIKMKEIF